MKKMVLLLVLALAVSACGKKKESFNVLEDARGQARANAEFNATKFRADVYPDYNIISRGDSTQSAECPQGDGWVSIDLVSPDRSKTIKLKCSSVSSNIGCMTDADFKAKPAYAQQDGKCQDTSTVPYPLPKLAK